MKQLHHDTIVDIIGHYDNIVISNWLASNVQFS